MLAQIDQDRRGPVNALDDTDVPEVSILVVSYNTREMTLDCLRSVIRETRARYEIIVIDNASTDGSAAAIAEEFPGIRLIASEENLGFGRANNRAGEEASGEYVLLLNPDTVILDGAIDRLLDFARALPEAKMWGGRTVFADGSPNPTNCYQDVTLWRLFCRAVGLTALSRNHHWFSAMYGGTDMTLERPVDVITGCFLLLPRVLWSDLRGFDPDFFLFDEETDLCMRARRHFGARPYYTPEAVIVHHVGQSTSSKANRIMRQLSGRLLLIDKHFSGVRRHTARGLVMLIPVTRAAMSALLNLIGRPVQTPWMEIWRKRRDWA
jgi:GT2 family glycosyltransferase